MTLLFEPLSARHVVVTRPAAQAGHLSAALAAQGAIPVLFPVLAIEGIADERPLVELARRLDDYDFAVFVSPNAVAWALDVILSHRKWPPALRAVTLGRSSQQELEARGIRDALVPATRFDSEALIELPELQQVRGRRVVIFRGDGGRELLGDTLLERGASVEYATCYKRGRPAADPAPLLRLWEQGQLDAVTLTSSEGVRNLWEMVGRLGQAWLKKTPVFVPHQRIAEQAEVLGLREIVATGPGDDGLMAGLLEYFAGNGKPA